MRPPELQPATFVQAPNNRLAPSIIEASHSTRPSHVKLLPNPAFVSPLSSNSRIAISQASKVLLNFISNNLGLESIILKNI
uniref:CSON009783 protein n=1 Tax=Culicoides sonorensis TaxID=179676 RepID=A0A336KGJ5_CULSO